MTDIDVVHISHIDIAVWVPYDEDIEDFDPEDPAPSKTRARTPRAT